MLFCGVDIGTTNTKAVLADKDFNLISTVNIPLAKEHLSGRVNADVWLNQFYEPIKYFKQKGFIRNEKLICGLSVQGGSFVCLDKYNMPMDMGFSWTETADSKHVVELLQVIGKEEFYKKVGWLPANWLLAVKLKQWLIENPENRKRLRKVAQIPELIFAREGKHFIADYTNTQISGLFDFRKREYINEVLDWLEISQDNLPDVVSTEDVKIDGINVDGIDVSIAGSMHDQYAVMIGCSFENSVDRLALSAGTAWVIDGVANIPIYDFEHFLIAPGQFVCSGKFGYISSLGQIGGEFHKLIEQAGLSLKDVRRMSENASINDFMISSAHQLRERIDKVSHLREEEISRIIVMGGAAKNKIWMQIVADVCQVELEIVEFSELAAYGAMRFAYAMTCNEFPKSNMPNNIQTCVISPKEN